MPLTLEGDERRIWNALPKELRSAIFHSKFTWKASEAQFMLDKGLSVKAVIYGVLTDGPENYINMTIEVNSRGHNLERLTRG